MIDGETRSVGGRWSKRYDAKDINHLEAETVKLASEAFADNLSNRMVKLVVDSTTVKNDLKRGSARSGLLNSMIGGALRSLGEAKPVGVEVAYIVSELNVSDAPSRGQKINASLLKHLAHDIESIFSRSIEINIDMNELHGTKQDNFEDTEVTRSAAILQGNFRDPHSKFQKAPTTRQDNETRSHESKDTKQQDNTEATSITHSVKSVKIIDGDRQAELKTRMKQGRSNGIEWKSTDEGR